jgi:DNA polymerase-3 subunit beta
MKITAKASDIVAALNTAMLAVNKKSPVLILQHVLLETKGGRVAVTGTDLDVTASTTIKNAFVDEEGVVVINAQQALGVCKALPKDADVIISYNAGWGDLAGLIDCQQTGMSVGIETMPAEDFPPVAETGTIRAQFSVANRDLRSLLEATATSMAKNDVRDYLKATLLELQRLSADDSAFVNTARLKIVATDGHRMAIDQAPVVLHHIDDDLVNAQQIKALVSREAAICIRKALPPAKVAGEALVQITDGHIIVMFDAAAALRAEQVTTITSKLVNGTFPDYARVMPADPGTRIAVDRKALIGAINAVMPLTLKAMPSIQLHMSESRMSVKALPPGPYRQGVPIFAEHDLTDAHIAGNPGYLLDAVKALAPSDQVHLFYRSATDALLVRGPHSDVEHQMHLIMPMRP